MPDVTASYGTPFDFISFFSVFIHYWRAFMIEVSYLHQTFTDYMFDWYTSMPTRYGRFSYSIKILENFSYITICFKTIYVTLSNFYKLCVKAEVLIEMKINLYVIINGNISLVLFCKRCLIESTSTLISRH